MLFIGICGASGSGKSTLADSLAARLGENCFVLQQDCYYQDHPNLTFEERVHLNYDEPQIFDHDALLQDVLTLMEGKSITRKAYDYAQHRRADTDEIIMPPEVLILEGIHSFHDERLRKLMYLKLYMSVEPDICLLRRIQRDIKERGREIDGISEQYLTTVKPMYDAYIRNYVTEADVIVARGGKNARIVDILSGYVADELNKRSAE
ncbi:MAG: uridine kinase [Clostridiales bacterium]|nr:uridine kinase [Clostridiales bacterium]